MTASPQQNEPIRVIVESEPMSGAWNMAIDEVLLESALRHGICTLRWYRWREPTLSLSPQREPSSALSPCATSPTSKSCSTGSPTSPPPCDAATSGKLGGAHWPRSAVTYSAGLRIPGRMHRGGEESRGAGRYRGGAPCQARITEKRVHWQQVP